MATCAPELKENNDVSGSRSRASGLCRSSSVISASFRDGGFDDNLQEQRDEVLALQSIFNTDDDEKLEVLSHVDDDGNGIFTLGINVCLVPAADRLRVDVALPAVGTGEEAAAAVAEETSLPPKLSASVPLNRSVSGCAWRGSFEIKYPSPMCLLVTFPPSYPSSDPPMFRLMCDWLTNEQLASLCLMMDKLWQEGCSMPIVYTWLDWLENNALSHLEITDSLILQPKCPVNEPKAIEDNFITIEDEMAEVITTMIHYNQEKLDEEFCQSTHLCLVCYDEKSGAQFFRMFECPHHFCHDCMTAFCEMHVQAGTVEELRCPEQECDSIIPPYIVQAVLGPESYQRWEQMLLQKTLDAMSDTVYCPRCQSLVIREEEEELHLAHCTVCFFTFCTECERCWHQGRNCQSDEDILETVKNQNRDGLTAAERQKLDELRRRLEDEIANKKAVNKSTRNCPSCKIPVEKIGGCNKMTCKCGAHFCWICGKKIDGYNHFRTGSCQLFPGQQTAPNAVIVRRRPDAVLRIQAQLEVNPNLANNRCQCPMCKQINLKGYDRNNHIKCWNCKSNFCFLCRQHIQGNVMSHFTGPCLQHS